MGGYGRRSPKCSLNMHPMLGFAGVYHEKGCNSCEEGRCYPYNMLSVRPMVLRLNLQRTTPSIMLHMMCMPHLDQWVQIRSSTKISISLGFFKLMETTCML